MKITVAVLVVWQVARSPSGVGIACGRADDKVHTSAQLADKAIEDVAHVRVLHAHTASEHWSPLGAWLVQRAGGRVACPGGRIGNGMGAS